MHMYIVYGDLMQVRIKYSTSPTLVVASMLLRPEKVKAV